MPADFQIIGGGLIGLSTAYALLLGGAGRVRVLEAREGVALETSFANAGMVHASLAAPWNAPGIGQTFLKHMFGGDASMQLRVSALPSMAGWGLEFLRGSSAHNHWHAAKHNYELAAYSMQVNKQWREALSIDDSYDGDGLLKVFRTQKEYDKAKKFNERLEGLGLETQYLDGRGAANKEPALEAVQSSIAGAFYYPHDFKADAYAFCKALEREITQMGGEIITNVHVDSLVQDGNQVSGVTASGHEYYADVTVVANGALAYQLLYPLGLKLPVRPVKGYSLSFPLRDCRASIPKIPVVDESLHAAITPFDECIRIAGIAEISGFNSARSRRSVQALYTMLRDVYPDIAAHLRLEDGKIWHGFRPVSAYGLPFIGRAGYSGLALNVGHGHMGWTLCAGSAAALADILLDQPLRCDVSACHPKLGL